MQKAHKARSRKRATREARQQQRVRELGRKDIEARRLKRRLRLQKLAKAQAARALREEAEKKRRNVPPQPPAVTEESEYEIIFVIGRGMMRIHRSDLRKGVIMVTDQTGEGATPVEILDVTYTEKTTP